jgi:hypothetical protein
MSHIKRSRTCPLPSTCDNFLYEELQGRTFGAPGLTAQAVEGEGGREQSGRKSGQGDPP